MADGTDRMAEQNRTRRGVTALILAGAAAFKGFSAAERHRPAVWLPMGSGRTIAGVMSTVKVSAGPLSLALPPEFGPL